MDSKGNPTTLEEIEALEKDPLIPSDVAGYLRTSPYTITVTAREGKLPWAYPLGKLTKIPKQAFLHYHRYGMVSVK